MGYQTGARIVRRAQEQADPSWHGLIEAGGDARRFEVHNTVRWSTPDIGIEIQFARVTEAAQPE
jgi:hypothetical protein